MIKHITLIVIINLNSGCILDEHDPVCNYSRANSVHYVENELLDREFTSENGVLDSTREFDNATYGFAIVYNREGIISIPFADEIEERESSGVLVAGRANEIVNELQFGRGYRLIDFPLEENLKSKISSDVLDLDDITGNAQRRCFNISVHSYAQAFNTNMLDMLAQKEGIDLKLN